jgi:uncharacterized LabA/DUF88 family protein
VRATLDLPRAGVSEGSCGSEEKGCFPAKKDGCGGHNRVIDCLPPIAYIRFIRGPPLRYSREFRATWGPCGGPFYFRRGYMSRAAIFVDAGYLFAQGSVALAGAKQPRTALSLNVTAVIAELKAVYQANAAGCELLRVYWYDGAVATRPTLEHTTLAHTDNVKLRLGFINASGQQKGVDSLIVTDLIDLARNHAICDAILLSGDEDVRIGVQIAQQFGVRLHLVGIVPVRGSQSRTLQQEADTTTEWDQATVAKFLSVIASVPATTIPVQSAVLAQPATVSSANLDPALEKVVTDLCASLDSTTTIGLKSLWQSQFGVPPEYDGKLLAIGRAAVGRDLSLPERKLMRARFKATVQSF